MNLRAQARVARRAHRLARQEDLFRDFICAASKTYSEAIQTNEPKVEELIALYGMVSRMRVRARAKTIECAQMVLDETIKAYLSPNKTIPDLHAMLRSGEGVDPLCAFAEAAREELGNVVF
jgi:hypothetical protein